jgi:farnesyl-diphosphate farnesyltransferase
VTLGPDLDGLLERTSRTFALSIPMLPEPTRRHVGIAYLLFRIADTFEDAVRWPREARTQALDDLAGLLQAPGHEQEAAQRWTAQAPVDHAGYLELLAATPTVMNAYWRVPAAARGAIRRDLLRTVRGMIDVVQRADDRGNVRLTTVTGLRAYCYVVAGIVGEMLTELFLLDDVALGPIAPRLRRRSRFFGEGLQLVNILKDAAGDAQEGRTYLPASVDRASIIALARRDLDHAASYVALLQRAGASDGLVAFTASPVILARASLDRVEALGPGAKLTRPEVARLIEQMFEAMGEGRDPVRPDARIRSQG